MAWPNFIISYLCDSYVDGIVFHSSLSFLARRRFLYPNRGANQAWGEIKTTESPSFHQYRLQLVRQRAKLTSHKKHFFLLLDCLNGEHNASLVYSLPDSMGGVPTRKDSWPLSSSSTT